MLRAGLNATACRCVDIGEVYDRFRFNSAISKEVLKLIMLLLRVLLLSTEIM